MGHVRPGPFCSALGTLCVVLVVVLVVLRALRLVPQLSGARCGNQTSWAVDQQFERACPLSGRLQL